MKTIIRARHGVLAIVAFTAGAAHGVTPLQVPTLNKLLLSGSSSIDDALTSLLLQAGTSRLPRLCQPGTIDVYVALGSGTDVASAPVRVVGCTIDIAMSSLSAGTNVMISKTRGDSFNGTIAVADAAPVLALDVRTNISPACATTTSIAANTIPSFPNHQAFTLHSDCSGIYSTPPDAGFSAVEPTLMNVGTQPISPAQADRLTSDMLYQPVYGVGVSTNLYRALQRAQGKVVGSDGPDDVPSLSSPLIASIYAGAITSWNNVVSSSGVPVNSSLYTASVSVPDTIHVCRRGDTSGTQAIHAAYFLRERCVFGVPSFVQATNTTCQQNGCSWNSAAESAAVFAGSSEAEVRKCLDRHNDLDHFAVGTLSSGSTYDGLQSLGGSANAQAGTQQFRYVALDGRKPNLESVAYGQYDFVGDHVLNIRNAEVNGIPAPSSVGAKRSISDYIRSSFNDIDVVKRNVISQPHGLTGVLADPIYYGPNAPLPLPVSSAYIRVYPVSGLSRAATGRVDNCQPAIPPGSIVAN